MCVDMASIIQRESPQRRVITAAIISDYQQVITSRNSAGCIKHNTTLSPISLWHLGASHNRKARLAACLELG